MQTIDKRLSKESLIIKSQEKNKKDKKIKLKNNQIGPFKFKKINLW